MPSSEYTCGNCEEDFQINTEGGHIQPCPECGSQEMVKGLNPKEKGGE